VSKKETSRVVLRRYSEMGSPNVEESLSTGGSHGRQNGGTWMSTPGWLSA
jgi:hypothetical protein